MIVFSHALLSGGLSRGLERDQTSEACIGQSLFYFIENDGGILMQSEHFTIILVFTPLCLYKNIPYPSRNYGGSSKYWGNPPS